MCGRYSLSVDFVIVKNAFDDLHFDEGLETYYVKRYNIAPTQPVLAITHEHRYQLKPLRWGLIPSWNRDPKATGFINARSETLLEKPSFKNSARYRRCLIVADGYFEWQKKEKQKIPYWIHSETSKCMTFAGLWETTVVSGGGEIDTCAIITTPATESLREIHERMPAILTREEGKIWMDPSVTAAAEVRQNLLPLLRPSGGLVLRQVSTAVNSVRNDSKEILEPSEDQLNLF